MELKHIRAGEAVDIDITFNRTSMELKLLQRFRRLLCGRFSFNRTSNGIETLSVSLRYTPRVTFNRTSMELKLDNGRVAGSTVFLLIEPVWN